MGYPYGPQQGQGYPPVGQQGYAPPVYGGYPAPGYAQPQPGYGPRPVSGGTGIAAASLALLISLVGGIVLAVSYSILADAETGRVLQQPDGTFKPEMTGLGEGVMVGLAIGGIACLLWLLGAVLLFRRTTAGRVIVIVLATLGVLGGLGSLVVAAGTASPATVAIGVVQAGFAVLVLCLAAAPSTGRWIQAARIPPAYPHGPYQQY